MAIPYELIGAVPIAVVSTGDTLARPARGLGAAWLCVLLMAAMAACGGAGKGLSWQGVDMREIARQGNTAALEPVAGKVTVFDFWAAWCTPCRELDRRLAELGRRYPGRLAIRKLEVVDATSPVAEQHLSASTSLPHVKIFGPDGELRVELSASPADIARQVESLLDN